MVLVKKNNDTLELGAVKKLLPKSHASMLTQDFLDRIMASVTNPEIAEQFKDNFISYTGVLSEGKYSLEEYVSAVKYVSFKLLGYNNIEAYVATFPERYERVKDLPSGVHPFAQAYNRTKLVNKIYEQTMVPTYVLNAPLHQEALTELGRMIKDPNVRGMTRVKACEAILSYTRPPEVAKAEIKIGMEQQSTISELREVTESLAAVLQKSLESGESSLQEVTGRKIIDVTPEAENVR